MISNLAGIQVVLNSAIGNSKQRWYLGAVMLLMGITIYLRYSQHVVWRSYFPARDYLLIFIPFALAFFLRCFFRQKQTFLSERWFWILLFMSPGLFIFRSYFSGSFDTILLSQQVNEFARATLHYGIRAVLLMAPVYLFWFRSIQKRNKSVVLNFSTDTGLLILLLCCTLPLIALAATQYEFSRVYPKAILYAGLQKDDPILNWIVFELSYALDFLSIEIFFRGFLIIAFIRYVGIMAIVPAACFYCCIHFDKPMAEAISSFFGGLLLGTISYYTRNIWTGFVLHLAMAWLMEFACFCLYYL